MEFSYSVIKRSIKNPRLEFRHGDLFVIVPKNRIFNVEAFLARHKQWIIKHKQRYNDLEKNKNEIILQPRQHTSQLPENIRLSAGQPSPALHCPGPPRASTWIS
jgi:predicted metal-dependent hydrolase